MTVVIGVHRSNPSLYHLSRLGYAEEELAALGETVTWHPYTDGVRTGAHLADGTIDFGGTGSTPPVTAPAPTAPQGATPAVPLPTTPATPAPEQGGTKTPTGKQ